MHPKVAKPFSEHNPLAEVAQSYGRALLAGRRLPPGDLVDILELERRTRAALLDIAAEHGPVFKGIMHRRMVVCVVGHALGRRVLIEHAKSLRPLTIEIESLVPKGFMRGMAGETHRNYRRALVQAISALDPRALDEDFEAIAGRILARYAASTPGGGSPDAWLIALNEIAASCLIVLFYGARPETDAHARLVAAYQALGPHGVVWNITERQASAFRALSGEIDTLGQKAGGILKTLSTMGMADATMLGNLIYMVEIGRYDLRGLLRWISRYAADAPAWLEQIAFETNTSRGAGDRAAQAFVLETLRMNQSERVMRDVRKNFIFEGWLIPKGGLLRVCMWETHKDADTFPRPFVFDPARFFESAPAAEHFSPFGLDHHHCPLAELSVRICSAFLRALSTGYDVAGHYPEPAMRGPYHFEPSSKFFVGLDARRRKRLGA
ncbi:MAG TPA: cytochrome P450 [Casimicrobiaceae bacterium]|nr:cytochrome P450 [Casimicrobiaceae bacterium]